MAPPFTDPALSFLNQTAANLRGLYNALDWAFSPNLDDCCARFVIVDLGGSGLRAAVKTGSYLGILCAGCHVARVWQLPE